MKPATVYVKILREDFDHMRVYLACLMDKVVEFKRGKGNVLLKNKPMNCLRNHRNCTERNCRKVHGL
jgi:hypothetical protein